MRKTFRMHILRKKLRSYG